MKQSRMGSFVEACLSTLIGFVVSYSAWPVVVWFFDMPYNHAQHIGIITFFTVISVIRGYVIRRWFNARLHKAAMKIANTMTGETK